MISSEKDHPFDKATQLIGESDQYFGQTSKHYDNMVGPFGGIIASVMLRAPLDHPERQGDPVALTVNYAAPVSDGNFDIQTKLVRTNRSSQHWMIELSQQGLVAATASAIFANRRDTWSSTELRFPITAGVEKGVKVKGEIYPSWVNRYDIRVIKGGIPPYITIDDEKPFINSATIQWVRDEPRRPIDFLSLAALCDTFFPRIFIRRNQFVPIGTVSFTVYFHADAEALSAVGDREVLGQARAKRFFNNYFDQTGEVWGPDGELLATTSQIVYFKE